MKYKNPCRTFLVGTLLLQKALVKKSPQYTDPPSALGFWIALEKCTANNGALSFLPGSHLTTPITKRFVRLGDKKGTGFESLVPEEEKEITNRSRGEYRLETCEPGLYTLLQFHALRTYGRPVCRWPCSYSWICITQVGTEHQSSHTICVYISHDWVASLRQVWQEKLVAAHTRDAFFSCFNVKSEGVIIIISSV